MANISEILKNVEKVTEEHKKLMADAVAKVFKQVFDDVPELVAIKWRQYTPYWNDGEACEFSVNDPEFIGGTPDMDELADWQGFDYDGELKGAIELAGWKDDNTLSAKKTKLLKDLRKAMCNDLEDALKDAFGDHAQITVTKDGVTVDEYEHE